MQIASDGACSLGLINNDQAFEPTLLECPTLRDDLPEPPTFPEKATAQEWLDGFKTQALAWQLEAGLIRHPLQNDIGIEGKFKRKLRQLRPLGKHTAGFPFNQELWTKHREDLLRLYEALADDESREVLLRRVKADVLGESGYLTNSPYEVFAHPASQALYPGESTAKCLRLEKSSRQSLQKLSAKISWYHLSCDVVLPRDKSWIDVLCDFLDAHPDYSLYLGQHGLDTVLYAFAQEPGKVYPTLPSRTLDGQALVSVVLWGDFDDDEALTESVESVLKECLRRVEILLVAEDFTDTSSVDELVRKYPWQLRVFKSEDSLNMARIYDLGLELAQGEYVLFLRCGECMTRGVLAKAYQKLEETHADFAICSESCEPKTLSGREAFDGFLRGISGISGLSNCLINVRRIHQYGLTFQACSGERENGVMTLALLHLSDKVVCLAENLVQNKEEDDTSEDDEASAFFSMLSHLASFLDAHDLSGNFRVSTYVEHQFQRIKPAIAAWINDNEDHLEEFLESEIIPNLQHFPCLTQAMLLDITSKSLKDEEDHNFSIVYQESLPQTTDYIAYTGASDNYIREAKLSIIIVVENSENLTCLENITEYDNPNIECIVIDNSQNQKTESSLEEYAILYPEIKLYSMKEKTDIATCRNLGLELAQAQFITFMESDDEPDNEFLTQATELLFSKETSDVTIFNVQSMNGESNRELSEPEEIVSGEQAISVFLENELSFVLAGIIFRNEALRHTSIKFTPCTIDQEEDFLLRVLISCPSVCFSQAPFYTGEKLRKTIITISKKTHRKIN